MTFWLTFLSGRTIPSKETLAPQVAHDGEVPANKLPQRVDDVFAFEGDRDYAIEALRAEVTSQGVMSSDCGPVAQRPYGLAAETLPTGDIPDGPQGVRIADLTLTLPATVGDGCVVAGGVVTILFQAVDGHDS